MSEQNQRKSYSYLAPNGRIVWVDPEPAAPPKAVRTRLETDAEVRSRMRGAGYTVSDLSRGKALDDSMRIWGLPPRKQIDETV